jgi:hypothetical protein
MEFQTFEEVVKAVKNQATPETWISNARELSKTLKALVYGDDFHNELIEHIEKIESIDRKEAREKYSKDIRDLFSRVLEPRTNVFSASGGSVNIDINSDKDKEELNDILKEFKGNKSLSKYLAEYFFKLLDVDPNGLIMLEYIKDEKIYPVYKSINDIRYYKSNGQNLEYLICEPKQLEKAGKQKWRVVDSKTDWCILQDGETFILVEDETFTHPFGEVPAIILSDVQKLGTESRLSPLFPIEELSKDYARDKSILTVYKFLQGFPIHWRYTQQCRPCVGTGKTGGKTCSVCSGKGILGRNDVTDVLNLPMPREGDTKIAPDLAGFVSPDLDTWERYNEDQLMFEEKMENTLWGTHRVRNNDNKNETATGRYIDVQPVMNKLNDFSDNVEWAHNQLANWTIKWLKDNPNTEDKYHISYGRSFIIESTDSLLEKYETARKDGSNWSILDKLLDEYMLGKYRNNPVMLEAMYKKSKVEPYIHMSIIDVNNVFGNEEAQRKQLFGIFWDNVEKEKTIEVLQKEFKAFAESNIKKIVKEDENPSKE